MTITTTKPAASTRFQVDAYDRRIAGLDFLPEGKVIQISYSVHLADSGIIAGNDIALSVEEAIALVEKLSASLAKATAFTE
jgi:hypothetical protein